ncbi:MAG: hypothetical protein GY839_01840 [candidate division Zixibacteria bacterium]|nr:hypothetical protein [candidate division Zixibacteria bacterium]
MAESKKDKTSLLDVITTIVKWRRLLFLNFMAAGIITFIVASFLPKWYSSSAALFPPEKDSGGFGLASTLLGGGLGSLISGSGMSLPAFATLSDVYATIIRSRIVGEGVLDKNNLMEVYKIDSREEALIALAGHRSAVVEPEGVIRISCEDKDPQRAVDMVYSFIEELNRINREVRIGKATATRQFIEKRLNQTMKDLAAAEVDYKEFQQNNKAISLTDQVSAMIGNLAELKGQLVLAEIELGVFERTFHPDHTQVVQQKAKINEINKQLELLESGSPDDNSPLSIAFSDAPELGLQLVRLTRQLKIQETIFELLTQQYEQAKIQEKRDTPTIQILDPPKVPEKKSSPKRATMALMAGILALFFTTIAVFIKEFIDRNKREDTVTYHQLEDMLQALKNDFYAIRSIFIRERKGQ